MGGVLHEVSTFSYNSGQSLDECRGRQSDTGTEIGGKLTCYDS